MRPPVASGSGPRRSGLSARFLASALLLSLLSISIELHAGTRHATLASPAPISFGASHALQGAHLDDLEAIQPADCPACVLRSRQAPADLSVPAGAVGSTRGARAATRPPTTPGGPAGRPPGSRAPPSP